MNLKILITLCFLSALVLAACGSSSSGQALSKAEFTERAEAICQKGKEARFQATKAALHRPAPVSRKAGRTPQEELVVNATLPAIVKMTEELDELAPPAGEERDAEQVVRSFEAEIARIEKNPRRVLTGSGGKYEEANERAGTLSLKACAQI